jgi:TolA-binding protein
MLRSYSLLLCVGLSGCWMSSADGEQLRTTADSRGRRIEQLEAQARVNREQIDGKVAELEDVLQRATKLLTRDSADVGAQVEQMQEHLAVLEGKLDEQRHETENLAKEVAAQRAALDQKLSAVASSTETVDESEVPKDRASHYALAYQNYETGKHTRARALFREYLTRYENDGKAGNAQYWIGSSYLMEGKPATALGEYRKVISSYGKSGAVDVALYGMAEAFYKLHACSDAQSALETLIKRKPVKTLKERAKKLLKEVKSTGKSYCTS